MRYIVGKIHIVRGCVVGRGFGISVIGGGGDIDLTFHVNMGF